MSGKEVHPPFASPELLMHDDSSTQSFQLQQQRAGRRSGLDHSLRLLVCRAAVTDTQLLVPKEKRP